VVVRRRLAVVLATAMMLAMMVAAGPAFGSHVKEHPFCGSGDQYAQEHITAMAQNDSPGLTGPPSPREADPEEEHAPGAHKGFAVCDPSGHAGSEE
jgi:hypothetical protein